MLNTSDPGREPLIDAGPQQACLAVKLAAAHDTGLASSCVAARHELVVTSDLKCLSEIRSMVRITCETSQVADCDDTHLRKKIAELELALTELVSNVIRHGFDGKTGGWLEVSAGVTSDGVFEFQLVHNGRPFDGNNAEIPEITNPQDGGMGLFLISECVDQVSYDPPVEDTCRIYLTKNLLPSDQGDDE